MIAKTRFLPLLLAGCAAGWLWADAGLEELIEYCDDYFALARQSLEHNATIWGDGYSYDRVTEREKKWLRRRADYLYSHLTPYEIDEDEVTDDLDYQGDTDGIEIHEKPLTKEGSLVDVYDLNGRCVKRGANVFNLRTGLRPGIYIVGGKKMVIRGH